MIAFAAADYKTTVRSLSFNFRPKLLDPLKTNINLISMTVIWRKKLNGAFAVAKPVTGQLS